MNPPEAPGPPASELLVPLGRTGWSLWPDVAVRGAGFAADQVRAVCDDELATAADRLETATEADPNWVSYTSAYEQATARLTTALRRIAGQPRFREALTWQNRKVVGSCLDKLAAGEPRNARGRGHELTVVSYLQRYCLKNDSIGFFGPVGWATLTTAAGGLSQQPGTRLLRQRETMLEDWAINALAGAIAARAEVWPWLRPRRVAYARLVGSVLTLPFSRPVTLSRSELQLWQRCDGRWPVRDLVGEPPDLPRLTMLLRLRNLGAVDVGLGGPPGFRPECSLAERIAMIDDPTVARRVAAPLTELTEARGRVAAAAGDPGPLATAIDGLNSTFERVTGRAAHRLPGETYAGRTIAFEDTVRDVDVQLGRAVTDRIAESLGPVLDSASWLVDDLAARYESRARQVVDRELLRSGQESMPLHLLMAAALPELLRPDQDPPDSQIRTDLLAEFQRRWGRVLALPDQWPAGVQRYRVEPAAVAERAAAEFAVSTPRWSGVGWHSPDLMLIADDDAALRRGDVEVVLGELHSGVNTIEGRLLVSQHPDPQRLRAAAAASGVDDRVIFVLPRDTPRASGRLARDERCLLPTYTYVVTGSPALQPPESATVVSLMDLSVRRLEDRLVVRDRHGAEHAFAEVIGEPLCALFLNGFQPLADTPYRPRISVGPLVLGRESWTFTASDLGWSTDRDEARRYAQVRRWRAVHGLPERCFYRLPTERKPLAVDFTSLPLVNLFAKGVRGCATEQGHLTVSEMLPDLDRLWLVDADGARYTAELRLVAVREARRSGPSRRDLWAGTGDHSVASGDHSARDARTR